MVQGRSEEPFSIRSNIIVKKGQVPSPSQNMFIASVVLLLSFSRSGWCAVLLIHAQLTADEIVALLECCPTDT